MKTLCCLLMIIFSNYSYSSETLIGKVHDIDYGKDDRDDILVLLSTGHVLKISKDDKQIVELSTFNQENLYEFTYDKNRYVKEWKELSVEAKDVSVFHDESAVATYVPTTVASLEVLKNYHREARRGWTEDAQCFNKGMVWSYEWWKKHSLKSMKLFIFFSRTYIRRYNFEWWFHVAPYAHVMENGKVVERMMDIKYTSRPLAFKDWSDLFMKNDATCKVVTKYSEHADYPYTGECYFMRANMYTYQPADLEMLEAWNYQKNAFVMTEVRGAYEQGFQITLP